MNEYIDYIKGITFAPFARRGVLASPEARESFEKMLACTNTNFVILVPGGIQDTPQSEGIEYAAEWSMSDDELCAFIDYAHNKGIRVALKPTVNCKNGTWRAHICFFDEDVPCEPKWGNWFSAYTDFQLHYARIAEAYGCEMFIAGCEMVQSEKRETEWRRLIADIRTVYSGPVSYNTDKYQEHNVKWWDAVDVISSSGYYPVDDWERQLDRIEAVVKKYDKPFFFAECGCMSTEGSKYVPNDWSIRGSLDPDGQAEWYEAMFSACKKRSWIMGHALWAWSAPLTDKDEPEYDIHDKPAETVVRKYFSNGESRVRSSR